MCGIAGIVDFGATEQQLRTLLPRMATTMINRGPDAADSWIADNIALGHTRNSVIDVEGGTQPMIATDINGHPIAVIDYVGEVYNFRDLATELAAHGHRLNTTSDTEVVLHAYLEWGNHFVEHLDGIFGFVIWDIRSQTLILTRDFIGVKPLYYAFIGGGIVFGSEPKALIAHPEVSSEVDPAGFRAMMTYGRPPGTTTFADLHVVKPGHLMTFSKNGMTETRYWSIPVATHDDDLDTTIATVRSLARSAVRRQCVSDVPWGVLLSGGLDSSMTAACAADAFGPGLPSFTLDFDGHLDRFQPTHLRPASDLPFAQEMSQHLSTRARTVVLDSADLSNPVDRAAVLRAWDEPIAYGDSDVSLYQFCREVKTDATMVISGEGADELFLGYDWLQNDTLDDSTLPWFETGIEVSGAASLLDADLLKFIDVEGHARKDAQLVRDSIEHLPQETPADRRNRVRMHLALTRFIPQQLDRMDRMSMASALEVRVPLLDRKLVEYAVNIPWAMQTFDGREKSILRAAAADLVSPGVIQRRKSNYPMTQDPQYAQLLEKQFVDVVSGGSPVTDLMDAHVLDNLRSTDRDLSATYGSTQLEQVLRLDLWLRSGVKLRGF
ncbi:asparagine synthase (glutamine-hydrolyzing) [Nocardia australiensis]|uniref:asparagine synthase (glutamine-hydrolyzing) n=1 Tax=Nocardia australiensis TaxID=2887191 RepID=UPI001D13E47E|nr:asparagine synthase (glutamine-hydrolyzing) [Nocardia australiensis]